MPMPFDVYSKKRFALMNFITHGQNAIFSTNPVIKTNFRDMSGELIIKPQEKRENVMKFNDELLDLDGRHVVIARVVSRITPAPIFNIYVAIIIVFTSPIGLGPVLGPLEALIICILSMVIAPITPIIYSAWRGHVDLDVSQRQLRTKFFAFSLGCYIVAIAIYSLLQCHVLSVLAAAYLTVTAAVMIATLKTKISVHAAGVGGPGTALVYMYGPIMVPIVFIWAAVVWARTVLRQHTIAQGVAGIIIGLVVTLTTYIILY